MDGAAKALNFDGSNNDNGKTKDSIIPVSNRPIQTEESTNHGSIILGRILCAI